MRDQFSRRPYSVPRVGEVAATTSGPHAACDGLPALLTPLIGRAREVACVCQALGDPGVRLVTLIGAGGIGKTRVALQAAAELRTAFADGVIFIDLAPISDANLVASTIAQALGVQQVIGQTVLGSLEQALRDRHSLLLLDDLEQMLAAASVVAALLQAEPQLKVIITR